MPRPTARVLALLELLQGGGTRTASELAALLGVDERTVRRYVDHLLELDVPVETVRGRYGGFRIGAGARLPPLMLTDDEAVAAALGLASVARTGPSQAVRTAAGTASAKLRRVLPERLAGHVPGLLEVRSTTASKGASATPSEAITTAAAAVRDHRPLRLRHRRGDRVTERTLLPWGVVEHEGRWYLTGLDSESDAVRTFRMDRLLAVETGAGRFTPPADADPVREVLASLAAAPRDFSVRIRIRASEEAVRRRLPPSIATLRPAEEPGWVLVSLEAAELGWVAGVLAAVDAPFRIEQPDALREAVAALAARLTERAATEADPARPARESLRSVESEPGGTRRRNRSGR